MRTYRQSPGRFTDWTTNSVSSKRPNCTLRQHQKFKLAPANPLHQRDYEGMVFCLVKLPANLPRKLKANSMSNETGDGARQIAHNARCRCQGSCGTLIPTIQDSAIGFNELSHWLEAIKLRPKRHWCTEAFRCPWLACTRLGRNWVKPSTAG